MKVFNNMKRPTKGYSCQEVVLFHTMLHVSAPFTSPSRITSLPSRSSKPSPSPSHEPSFEHSPTQPSSTQPSPTQPSLTQPSLTQPSPTQPSPGAEHHLLTPNESPLHVVHSHGSDEVLHSLSEDDLKKTKQTYSSAFTKLILRIKKLESKVKTGKAKKRARVVLSEDEEDDSSKQGRKISNIDEEPNTYFAQDDEVDVEV
ncbi:hypothetical protein Tco_0120207, partial [Tanacetum coccineum]